MPGDRILRTVADRRGIQGDFGPFIPMATVEVSLVLVAPGYSVDCYFLRSTGESDDPVPYEASQRHLDLDG